MRRSNFWRRSHSSVESEWKIFWRLFLAALSNKHQIFKKKGFRGNFHRPSRPARFLKCLTLVSYKKRRVLWARDFPNDSIDRSNVRKLFCFCFDLFRCLIWSLHWWLVVGGWWSSWDESRSERRENRTQKWEEIPCRAVELWCLTSSKMKGWSWKYKISPAFGNKVPKAIKKEWKEEGTPFLISNPIFRQEDISGFFAL